MTSATFDADSLKRLEREGYGAHAETYDCLLVPLTSAFTNTVLSMARIKKGESILDVACGTGPSTIEAARLVGASGRVLGIDIAPGMLSVAREKVAQAGFRNVEFYEMDAERLEFEDSAFDAAISQFGLMHFPDRLKALSEIRRVLKPDGRLSVSVWSFPEKVRVLSVFGQIVAKYVPELANPGVPTYYDFAPEGVLESTLVKAGLRKPRATRVSVDYSFDSAEAYWTGITASGKSQWLLSHVSGDVREVIKTEVFREVVKFADGTKLRFRTEALIGAAIR